MSNKHFRLNYWREVHAAHTRERDFMVREYDTVVDGIKQTEIDINLKAIECDAKGETEAIRELKVRLDALMTRSERVGNRFKGYIEDLDKKIEFAASQIKKAEAE